MALRMNCAGHEKKNPNPTVYDTNPFFLHR